MGARSGAGDSKWKLFIGLAVVCALLVAVAGFLHKRAVSAAADERQTKAANYVRNQLADAVAPFDLSRPLSQQDEKALAKALVPPAGDEARLYSLDAAAIFVTEGGRASAGDRDAISKAAKGQVSSVIDGGDSLVVYAPIPGKGDRPAGVAAVVSDYAALRADAVGALDTVRVPLAGLAMLFMIVGLALLVHDARAGKPSSVAVVGTENASTKRQKAPKGTVSTGRATGFDVASALSIETSTAEPSEPGGSSEPVPVTPPSEPAAVASVAPSARRTFPFARKSESAASPPNEPKVKKSLFARKAVDAEVAAEASAELAAVASGDGEGADPVDREVAIREALEDQLEQLRTQVRMQEQAAADTSRQLTEQLDAMSRRAEEAESRTQQATEQSTASPAPPGDADASIVAERLQRMESELDQARTAISEANARADALEREKQDIPQADEADPGLALHAQTLAAELAEAQKAAADSEQRTASIESVRGELEVRVAQLGSKAGELEQKATELETRLQEANAGGDAVRAEIATLTAALAASNARVEELESASVDSAPAEDVDAIKAEAARLRGELAGQMERAQAAEERVASLEADVFAARRGVEELPEEGIASEDAHVAAADGEHPSETNSDDERSAAVPPAPTDADRYDDVWSPPPADAVEKATEPVAAPALASAETEDDPAPEDSVTAEDDLWALRERLAHAADDRGGLRERLAHAGDDPKGHDDAPSAPPWS